jgi:hypothetical protein
MTIKKSFAVLIFLSLTFMMIACGGGSTTTPPAAAISVAIQGGLASSIGISTGVQMIATVSNDATGGGVDWTVTCGSNDCGSFSAAHTASGIATIYSSPATVPTGNTVVVTAASTKDSSKNAADTFTIVAFLTSVSFQTAPVTSMLTSGTTSLTADVTNDLSMGGIDWTVTCGSADCGSFNPIHTASGSATVYTAPATVPTAGTVTIAATSTDAPTKSATAVITISVPITAYNQMLNGTYVFEIRGSTRAANPYGVVGVFAADGNGNILGGTQVYKDRNGAVFNTIVNGTTYTFGTDGRGTIALHLSLPEVGVAGNETLGAVIISPSKALITEFDGSASGRGSLDLQTAIHPLNGGYAFEVGSNYEALFGGVLNVDNNPATGDVSGAGSVADYSSFPFVGHGPLTGSVTTPDGNGQVTITTTTANGNSTLIGFIVDDLHIKLIETDAGASGQNTGIAIAQGSYTGTYTENSALSGKLVYGLLGGLAEIDTGVAIAGSLTADGAGNLSGFMDLNQGASVVASAAMAGTYAVDGSGTGRISATTLLGATAGPDFVLYLTQPNLPALIMNTDVLSGGTGFATVQAAGPYLFSGSYGLDFTSLSGTEADGTASVVADGEANFAGAADVNSTLTDTPVSALRLNAQFDPDPSGRFPATVTLNGGAAYGAAFYFIDSTHGFMIENDNQEVTFGEFYAQQQLDPHARRGNPNVQTQKK